MFRYSRGDRTFIVPLNVPDVPYNGYFSANEFLPQVINNRGAVLSHTHTFSPRIVNEARFGFNRLYATVTPRSEGQNLATDFGVRGVPVRPAIEWPHRCGHHWIHLAGRQLRHASRAERVSYARQPDDHRRPA